MCSSVKPYELKEKIVLTMCHLETLFPPSFFTVMVHLMVHLVDEAKFGGLVLIHCRWMYSIEMYDHFQTSMCLNFHFAIFLKFLSLINDSKL